MAGPPDVVRWTSRSGDHTDCVAVALSLATGMTYEEVFSVCVSVRPNILYEGMRISDVRKALRGLGYVGRMSVPRGELDDLTGLLFVEDVKGERHATYLWDGRVIDPLYNGVTALWLDADTYISTGNWTVIGLMTLKEE